MKIVELLEKKGKYSFDVNEWGSCQYSGALAMYKTYFELRKEYSKEKILEYLKFEFNYDISLKGIRSDEEAIEEFFNILKIEKRWPKKFKFDSYYNSEKIDKQIRESDHVLVRTIRRACSAEDLFFVGRNAAYDLWATAPWVAKSYFIDFKTKNLPNCENPIGIEKGPAGNICAQSKNILTGLCCALLVDYEVIKNTKCFKYFDT